MSDAIFDPATFVPFADYAAAFLAGGFGFSLAFWLVGHAAAKVITAIYREV